MIGGFDHKEKCFQEHTSHQSYNASSSIHHGAVIKQRSESIMPDQIARKHDCHDMHTESNLIFVGRERLISPLLRSDVLHKLSIRLPLRNLLQLLQPPLQLLALLPRLGAGEGEFGSRKETGEGGAGSDGIGGPDASEGSVMDGGPRRKVGGEGSDLIGEELVVGRRREERSDRVVVGDGKTRRW